MSNPTADTARDWLGNKRGRVLAWGVPLVAIHWRSVRSGIAANRRLGHRSRLYGGGVHAERATL
jgi:hypothetical protein